MTVEAGESGADLTSRAGGQRTPAFSSLSDVKNKSPDKRRRFVPFGIRDKAVVLAGMWIACAIAALAAGATGPAFAVAAMFTTIIVAAMEA